MTTKTPIYFVPGLAASPKIFDFIKLPKDQFEVYYLEWLLPLSENETIEAYSKRMAALITHENPILIGVSFGGIIVQEMSKHIATKKVVIISSIKSHTEMSKRLRIIQKSRIYKLFPTYAVKSLEGFYKYAFGDFAKRTVKLYQQYLSVRNELYLKWAIHQVLHWEQKNPLSNILHIQGDNDHVFPSKHIKNCEVIKGGTHAMILFKAKKINEILANQLINC